MAKGGDKTHRVAGVRLVGTNHDRDRPVPQVEAIADQADSP